MLCPGCGISMQRLTLQARLGKTLDVDICNRCHAFWFDPYESLQLAPASTLTLFKHISEAGEGGGTALPASLRCVVCKAALQHSYDWQRGTRFEYWRCEKEHGCFVRFGDFLKEKSFVQVMSPAQIAELRSQVRTIHCSTCGAAVDLAKESSCTHCGSPLVMLDREAMARVASEYQSRPAPPPPKPHYRESATASILDFGLEEVASWVIEVLVDW
jgi:hypothetical protein